MTVTRDHAVAFLAATLAALVGNGVLQLALDAVRVSAYGSGVPWWMTAGVIERGRWVVFAAMLYAAAPSLLATSSGEAGEPDGRAVADTSSYALDAGRSDAWRVVGVAVLLVPLLWILGTWIVSALRFTLLGSWGTEGQVFLSPGYYRGLALDYVPWLLGGAVVRGVARHL